MQALIKIAASAIAALGIFFLTACGPGDTGDGDGGKTDGGGHRDGSFDVDCRVFNTCPDTYQYKLVAHAPDGLVPEVWYVYGDWNDWNDGGQTICQNQATCELTVNAPTGTDTWKITIQPRLAHYAFAEKKGEAKMGEPAEFRWDAQGDYGVDIGSKEDGPDFSGFLYRDTVNNRTFHAWTWIDGDGKVRLVLDDWHPETVTIYGGYMKGLYFLFTYPDGYHYNGSVTEDGSEIQYEGYDPDGSLSLQGTGHRDP